MNTARVDDFLAEMRTVAEHTAAPAPNARLMSALDGATPRRTLVALDTRAAMDATGTVATIGTRGRNWWRTVVAPAIGGVVLFGGLAGAGALPTPIQRATAGVVSHLGISLPGGLHHMHPGTPSAPDARRSTPSTAARTPTRSAPSPSSPKTGPASASSPTPTTAGTTPAPPVTPPRTPTLTVPLPPLTLPETPTLPALPGLPGLPHLGRPSVQLINR